jgi:putative membrane protein
MRLIRPLFAIMCLGLGVVIGMLNRDPVAIDLGPVLVRSTLGVALLGALLTGALAGGLAAALSRSGSSRRSGTSRPNDTGTEI